jgi:hypothetical protein
MRMLVRAQLGGVSAQLAQEQRRTTGFAREGTDALEGPVRRVEQVPRQRLGLAIAQGAERHLTHAHAQSRLRGPQRTQHEPKAHAVLDLVAAIGGDEQEPGVRMRGGDGAQDLDQERTTILPAERFEAMRGALPEELVVPRLVTSDPDEARRWVSGA